MGTSAVIETTAFPHYGPQTAARHIAKNSSFIMAG